MVVIDVARHVYKTLGFGHSEAIYHRAVEVGLRKAGVCYDTERVVQIRYQNHVVGSKRLDLVINDDTIVELKSVSTLKAKEVNQLTNYMRMTGIPNGILINFPFNGADDIEVQTISA